MIQSVANSGETALTYTYTVPRSRPGWELYEGTMPQSTSHEATVELLRAVFRPWVDARGGRIHYDLAIRWVEEDQRIGVNPDLSILIPPPPDLDEIESVCTWMKGHEPPLLAIEIVSETNPLKDYSIAPEKYAASGIQELWILDPRLFGPKSHGGPFRVQVWRRDEQGFRRIYEGDGPVYSPAVAAYLVATADGRRFRLANDAALTDFWLTREEAMLVREEAMRAREEAVLAENERLKAEAEQLKAELAKLKGG